MGFFVVFPIALFQFTPTIAGYQQGEVLLFFAMMNVVDVVSQIFFLRGLNLMPMAVNRGDFDVALAKPISPLFWTMFRVVDFFDVLTAPGAVAFIAFAWTHLPVAPDLSHILAWILFVAVALVISFGVVLTITALNFWTTETDNIHFVYRDSMNISRFPPEVFPRWAQGLLYVVVPTFTIVAVPAKALLGDLSLLGALVAIAIAFLWLGIGLATWRAGLRRYTSASS